MLKIRRTCVPGKLLNLDVGRCLDKGRAVVKKIEVADGERCSIKPAMTKTILSGRRSKAFIFRIVPVKSPSKCLLQ